MPRLLIMLVFFPMCAGLLSYYLGRWNKRARDVFVLSAACLELVLTLTIWMGEEMEGSWLGFCGLGLNFASGSFHTLMALLTATGWLAATILSQEYMAHVRRKNRYYVFWLFTLGATMGVFLSADLFTTFIFFEVMSFTSYVMVIQTEEADALRAGDTYLAVAVIGGLVTLSGLFLLYHQLGTLHISQLAQAAREAENRTLLWVGGLLTLVGFGAKAGAFPLHIWLPTAHPAAPAPASAVLSGVITKTGIYGVLVLSTTLFFHNSRWGLMLAVIGGVTMVLGAALAVFSIDLKRTLACSSVSQIGFILVGTAMQCLLGHHNALAVDGTILHIFNHSIIKMVLFPAAGIIHLTTHSFDLNDIRGFGRGKPLLAFIMGIPMLSLAGLPLLNGYVSKTLLHESIVEYIHLAGERAWLFSCLEWLFLFSGGLTFAYMLKLFVCIFVEKNRLPRQALEQKWRLQGSYIAPASAAALLTYLGVMLVLGNIPGTIMDAVAAYARTFLGGQAPVHPVNYFSPVNLKGAAISLSIGGAIYLFVVRTWLLEGEGPGQRAYVDRIPVWMNLENNLYRPALDLGSKVLIVLATFVDRIGFRLLFRGIPRLAGGLRSRALSLRDGAVLRLTGRHYNPRPSVEQAADDYHFGLYEDNPQRELGFFHSFAFGLMLTGAGLIFAIFFILLR